MKFTKTALFATAMLSAAGITFAQDFDDFDYSEEPTTSFTVGGSFETTARSYLDEADHEIKSADDVSTLHTEANATGKLNLTYSGISSDLNAVIKFDKNTFGEHPEDLLDEFTARAYLGNLQIEAGKMRVVWGKGDKNHVVDNFNANDYTDYIFPDYLDRRIAEPMFRAVYSTNSDVKFEAVWTPVMTADRLASSGNWQPKASKKLTSNVTELVMKDLADALSNDDAAALAAASSFSADSLYPDTYQLKYGQAGLRTTFTVAGFDLGLSYYYGHLKQPSANVNGLVDYMARAKMVAAGLGAAGITLADTSTAYPELEYDQVQVFGLEGATVFGPLNIRFEAAYNLTKDIAGDDPWVHNNSIAWEAGFDMDLPISNINFNIQTVGKYILNNDKIGDSKLTYLAGTPYEQVVSLKDYDVDHDANDCYTNNKIIVDITDSYRNETIKLDIKGVWGIERGDVVIMPSLAFDVKDDMTLNLSGLYIWCKDEDSEFDGWQHNSFAQVGIKYLF